MKFQFKHPNWGTEWQDLGDRCYDVELAAEGLASEYFYSDPCDPSGFEFDVQIKDPRGKVTRFIVTAKADVHFDVSQKELDDSECEKEE